MTLTSVKRGESSLRVGIARGGKARAVSHNGSVVVTDMQASDWDNNSSWHVNNHSDLKWSLSLAPGESAELTFEVEYFVY